MTAIAVFSGLFCNADSVVSNVVNLNGFHLISDHDIIMDAARLSGLGPEAFEELFRASDVVVYSVSRGELDRKIGWLRLALAERLSAESNVVVHGCVALLVNTNMEGILRVCLVSDMEDRLRTAEQVYGLTAPVARERIHADDGIRADWAMAVTEGASPWAEDLYDLLIPVAAVGVAQSAFLIVKQLTKVVMQDSGDARRSMKDFLLAAKASAALADAWQGLGVSARDGKVTVRFCDHAGVLDSFGRLLCGEVSGMTGVKGIEIRLGREYWQGDVYQRRGRRSAALPAGMAETVRPAACSPADGELAGRVEAYLAQQGYPVSVLVREGVITLTVNSHRSMLQVSARALCRVLAGMEGLEDIEVGVGTGYQRASSYAEERRRTIGARVADEGHRFSLTRSSRLKSPVRSFSVYDEREWSPEKGRQTEVLVLDVKASSDSGIDILRRIKRECPDVDVLILADRESEADRAAYLDLGAFAYLPKPVNLGVLGHTIWSTSGKGRFCSP